MSVRCINVNVKVNILRTSQPVAVEFELNHKLQTAFVVVNKPLSDSNQIRIEDFHCETFLCLWFTLGKHWKMTDLSS